MSRGVPVQPKTRAKIVDLIQQEVPRNQIARDCGVSTATVSRIAKAAGLEFDRSQTRAATSAREVDLAALRTRLAEKMADRSERMLDRLDSPYLVYNFGGKDNTYEEHTLDSPPVEVERNAVATAGIAFDKLTRIVERDSSGTDDAVGMLGALADGLRTVADQYRAEETVPDEAG